MTDVREMRARRVAAAFTVAAFASGAGAEVVIQGGQILPGPAIEVPASVGQSSGNNLFHSFSVFNVLGGLGESVTFTGPDNVKNVISRVTGGTSEITGSKASLIDGPLTVAIPGANFYFFNPNGVVFTENGWVQADGSVHISTADNLKLKDGGIFHADPTKTSTLTSAAPSAFGFLNPNPAKIEMNGPWMGEPYTPAPVPPGKTFALVGGDIEIRAGAFGNAAIIAPGANVVLASVASAGDVGLTEGGGVDVQSLDRFPTLGRVQMSGGSFIDVGRYEPGSIQIRAGELTLAPAALFAETYSPDGGGLIDIAVRGDLVAATDPETGFISIIGDSFPGDGAGPAIRLDVGGTLDISDGSYVFTESFGGLPSDIDIRAATLRVRGLGLGEFTGIGADNYGEGEGPAIRIHSATMEVLNGGFVGTRNIGAGTGGELSIEADSVLLTGNGGVTLSLSTETVGGDAGDLTLTARTLELRDGARISSSTGGFGNAGVLSITATEEVSIAGELSGIFSATVAFDADVGDAGNAGALSVATSRLSVDAGVIDSTTVGDGDAGDVNVSVDELRLTNGGQIRSFSGGRDTETGELVVGTGAAGSVTVEATGSVTASGTIETASGRFPSGLLAETRGEGAGGNVTVTARDLTLTDGATISSSSLGTGLAGDVRIALRDTLTMRSSSIATQAVTSDGGNIAVRVGELIDMVDSRITTSVESGEGGGGNIAIEPPDFVVLQRSQIIANAFGGPGGNIDIVAGQLIADPFSVIEASSALGIDGNVNIDAPNPDVGSNLVVLPESFLDAARLLQPTCGAARAGLSSLVEVGRGGLPADPDGYLMTTDGAAAPAARRGAAAGGLPGDVPVLAQVSCTR